MSASSTTDSRAPRRRPSPAELARRGAHADLTIMVACAAVIVASVVLSPGNEQLTLGGTVVPPLCLFKNLTGLECFGCGLSRSFTWMGHGKVIDAFAMHKLGPLLWLVVLLQVPLRIRALLRYRRDRFQAD